MDKFMKKNTVKVLDYILPVGHLLNTDPMFYDNKNNKFIQNNNYFDNTKYKENNNIIGYLSKEENITFKLRPPNSSSDIKDKRTISKGIICSFKDKNELLAICHKLKINTKDIKKSKIIICLLIEKQLLYNELKERTNGSNVKYYYC